MISKKLIMGSFVAAVAAFVLAITPAPAKADNATLALFHDGNYQDCTDGQACDGTALAGVVSFSMSGTDYSLGGIGSGAPATGYAELDLAYNLTQINGASGGQYVIWLYQADVTGPVTDLFFHGINNGNESSGVTTDYYVYADATNSLYWAPEELCHQSSSATVVDFSCGGSFSAPGNYSLTEKIVITAPANNAHASGDANLNPVPEPGTLAMFGSGLVSLAGIIRRKLIA